MKIFGVAITYDETETRRFREDFKNSLSPRKLRGLMVYEVTNENDAFKKYRCAFSFPGVIKLHIQQAAGYWLRRLRLFINRNHFHKEVL